MTDILAALYAQVPPVDCKGLCQASCGPIGVSDYEACALQDNGVSLPRIGNHPKHGPGTCSHLTAAGRCAIYAQRPMICRLFGAVEGLPCKHGCKPKGGHLPDAKAHELMGALDRLTGRPPYFSEGAPT